MFKLERAKKSDRIMKALTGLTIIEFEALVITFTLVLQKYQATRKPNRKRAAGGGRKHTLKTAAERLFFILFYLKCYPTMDLAGFFFGVDKSRIQRWVKELWPLLEETLGRELVLPARKINSVEEFIAQFPAVKDVFIDATERPVQRPQKNKAENAHFSGRKGRHTKKSLLVSDEEGQILILPPTKPGRRNDYFRFKQSGIGDILPPDVAAWVDLGFVGIEKDYPNLEVVIPPILTGNRTSIMDESRNYEGHRVAFAPQSAKKSGNASLLCPSTRKLAVTNRIQGAPGAQREYYLG